MMDAPYLFKELEAARKANLGRYARGDAGPSILVKKNQKKRQPLKNVVPEPSNKYAVAIKCSCNSVWCQKCFKKLFAPKEAARMMRMDWRRTRMVTLTLNPANWEDGEAAYIWYKLTKPIGLFIKNLGRNGVMVTDWTCNMEWHDNGYPHWHLLIEVDKPGAAGMIGQELLHKVWSHGDSSHRIHEWYFSSEKRFKDFTGYFAKSGYLHKDKQHQVILPGWASGRGFEGMKINRFSSMRHRGDGPSQPDPVAEPEKRISRKMTYAEKHDRCGQQTELWELEVFEDADRKKTLARTRLGVYRVPYDLVVTNLEGGYYQGVGYSFEGSTGFVRDVLKSWEVSPPRPPEKPREYTPALDAYLIDVMRDRHYHWVMGAN